MINDPRFQVILNQLETILLFLERPVVQRQILAFVIATVVAWLLAHTLRLFVRKSVTPRLRRHASEHYYWTRLPANINVIAFPVFGLMAIRVATLILDSQGWRTGLLRESVLLFWAILGYRIFVAVLFTIFGEGKVRSYQRYLLGPLFALFIAWRVISNLIDLNLLSQIELFTLFDNVILLGGLVITIIALYFLFAFVQAIQELLRGIIMPRTAADPGSVNAVLTIGRYTVIALGIFAIFNSLGLDLSTLAFIGGGLSIGIGFGLQQIVANFVSGIILLFEQSLRPGDVVDIDGDIATVEKLSIRSTTVRTLDNVEVVVPNETILNSSVKSYTKSSRLIRIMLEVGTSYNSDPKEVRDILLGVAQRHGLVQKEPAPYVFFKQFGESSIDFKLAVWIHEPTLKNRVSSELYFMIWYALAERKIEIPFPQRDLHLRNGMPWHTPEEAEVEAAS